jgi:hypothetical protein
MSLVSRKYLIRRRQFARPFPLSLFSLSFSLDWWRHTVVPHTRQLLLLQLLLLLLDLFRVWPGKNKTTKKWNEIILKDRRRTGPTQEWTGDWMGGRCWATSFKDGRDELKTEEWGGNSRGTRYCCTHAHIDIQQHPVCVAHTLAYTLFFFCFLFHFHLRFRGGQLLARLL